MRMAQHTWFQGGFALLLILLVPALLLSRPGERAFPASSVPAEKLLLPQDVSALVLKTQFEEFTVYQFSGLLKVKSWDLDEAEDDLWIGTDNGLLRFRTDTGKWFLYGETAGIPGSIVSAVVASSGSVLVEIDMPTRPGCMAPMGGFLFDPGKMSWQKVFERGVWDLAWQGNRFLFAPGALEFLDPVSKSRFRFDVSNAPLNDLIHAIFPWKNQIWVAMMEDIPESGLGGGVACLFLPERQWQRYTVGHGLATGGCFDLAVDDQNVWTCHWNVEAGLSHLDRSSGVWTPHLRTRDGIKLGGSRLALADGLVWIAQPGGLVAYDRISGKAKRYTQLDGMPGYILSAVKAGRNSLWAVAYSASSSQIRMSGLVRFPLRHRMKDSTE